MWSEAHADPCSMDDQVRPSRLRAILAVTLLMALGLAAAGSAIARPFHPAAEPRGTPDSQTAPSVAPDPKC